MTPATLHQIIELREQTRRAYRVHEIHDKRMQFFFKGLREDNFLYYPSLESSIILKWVLRKYCGLAQKNGFIRHNFAGNTLFHEVNSYIVFSISFVLI
jgi:hypothetical protein